LRALSRASGPLGRMLPLGALDMFLSLQRVALPVYTPALPRAGINAAVVDRAAL
jgi:nitronate monooxygenase